jgi:hypothetical protein
MRCYRFIARTTVLSSYRMQDSSLANQSLKDLARVMLLCLGLAYVRQCIDATKLFLLQ